MVRRRSGRYTVGVWGRAHERGAVSNLDELFWLCQKTFVDSFVCNGLVVDAEVRAKYRRSPAGSKRETAPVERLVSHWCHQVEKYSSNYFSDIASVVKKILPARCKVGRGGRGSRECGGR